MNLLEFGWHDKLFHNATNTPAMSYDSAWTIRSRFTRGFIAMLPAEQTSITLHEILF